MIYFIITTSVFDNSLTRKKQYINGINKLKEYTTNFKNYKIIIVENNGLRNTYLNSLGCEIYYTNNNSLPRINKGYRELQDILDCIQKYNINDSDFIVKMTGRYFLDDTSEFMDNVKNIDDTKYDCIIKYGSYMSPVNYKMNDCVTGLIGMRCDYVKQISKPEENECVEWKWAKVTQMIDDNKICMVDKLGIYICPGNDKYFLI